MIMCRLLCPSHFQFRQDFHDCASGLLANILCALFHALSQLKVQIEEILATVAIQETGKFQKLGVPEICAYVHLSQ